MPPTPYDIEHVFTYHAPTGDQPQKYADLRATAKQLARTIERLTPPSREQSLAYTKLEEAVFWANAAIARHPGVAPEIVVPKGD